MEHKKVVDFNKTTFHKGMKATFGKIPIFLEMGLDIQDGRNLTMEFYVGNDKMYRIKDIDYFLDAIENKKLYHLSKNFIFEPKKMYFQKKEHQILELLCYMKMRRKNQRIAQNSKEILFSEDESERLLDVIWDDVNELKWNKKYKKIYFENELDLKIHIEKNGSSYLMTMDYSKYGDFESLTINFRYIIFKHRRLIVKLSEENRDCMMNLYPFKNDENIVYFNIDKNEKRLFERNFLDNYSNKLKISIDKKVEEERKISRLLAKVYIDIASKGIISKIEFCYDGQIINPLYDFNTDKGVREIDRENKILAELKHLGFKEHGRLFLLDDVEKIMFLLTDKLTELKKAANIYYSVDFKKLYVKNLENFDFSLAEDGSVIHMDINLENVTDEELVELLEAIKEGKKYYQLRNGSIVNLQSAQSSKLVELINRMDINHIQDGLFEIPLNRCIFIDNYLRDKGVENVRVDTDLACLMKKMFHTEEGEIKLGEEFNGVLRDYQLTGVKWLQSMASYSFGGILADDMGLGKTIQVLAFLANQKAKWQENEEVEQNGQLPCIVVAPTSVVYNWKVEAEKFTPNLNVLVISGTKEKRNLLICQCKNYDVVITSYGALKNDVSEYQKVKFCYAFVDEAQNIKNPATLNANSVKSLVVKCAFALTGTPIENRLTELWSIFDFIMPGLLFDRIKFKNTYEEPIMREKNVEKMNELQNIIKPFMIRRMKREVLSELPEKIETNYYSEMTEEQKKLYVAFYKELKNELMPKIDEYGIAKNHMEILSALTRLRQVCAHPSTFMEDYVGGSGKLDLAMEMMKESIKSGHSILLFSQFTSMLKIIRRELEKEEINYYYLDGKMKWEDRMIEIENFNSDKEAVFLISLKAGGTGLNLTRADVVIHFDPWWNPAVEDQASDRAYRMGQENVVQVYNLLTEGTIEEKIAKLKEKKKDLIKNLIQPGENFLSKLSEAEIGELLGLYRGESLF